MGYPLPMFLSVVFPLERDFEGSAAWVRLERGLALLRAQLPYTVEAIAAVEPGDADRAAAARRIGLRVVEAEAAGHGALIATGLLVATGDYRALVDPSWPVEPEQLLMLLPPAQTGIDLAMASRLVHGATLTQDPWAYRLLLRLVSRLFGALLFAGLADSGSGVLVLRDEAAHAILGRIAERGEGAEIELCALARELGFTMAEVPVDWTVRRGGAGFGLLRPRLSALLRTRARLKAGAYPPLPKANPEEPGSEPLTV